MEKAYDSKSDPDHREGLITGISVGIREEPWQYGDERDAANPNMAMCYVRVTATIEGSDDDVVLTDDLLGIWGGDERPMVSHWRSCHGGVASGKRDDRFDDVDPDDLEIIGVSIVDKGWR